MTTATPTAAQQQGLAAELQAFNHLQQQGLTLVERNYLCRVGEIDLIMKEGRYLVFVEVRYRSSSHFGSAAASVDPRKQARLVNTASHYLQQHPALAQHPARFDVIAITPTTLEWIRDAFQAS